MRNFRFGIKYLAIIAVSLIVVLFGAIFFFSGPSEEEKQEELTKATSVLGKQVSALQSITVEWKNTWQNVAIGEFSFQEGATKLDAISLLAKDIANNSNAVKTPEWLEKQPKEEFDTLKKDIELSANALSIASKTGGGMLKSGKLTALDISSMSNHNKEATNYLAKNMATIEKFKEGYGLETQKTK